MRRLWRLVLFSWELGITKVSWALFLREVSDMLKQRTTFWCFLICGLMIPVVSARDWTSNIRQDSPTPGHSSQTTIAEKESILSKTSPRKYRIRISLELKSIGVKPDILVGELPLPESNEYQDIRFLAFSPGQKLSYPENGDKYLFCRFQDSDCPQPGSSKTIFYEFEATLYDLTVDFSKIDKIYPYDKDAPHYRRYTGKSGEYVNPNHPEIKRIAEQIATESKDPLEFARNAYLYVSENYKYLNPNTGLTPLTKLLQDGGGDCGNLSSIYISLLRNRGIPARHLAAMRPDGSWHYWADFYLENYGWIPVDVTYRNGDKAGDFFGRVRVESNGVILARGVDLSVINHQGVHQKVVHMQTFAYWWVPDNSGRSGRIECHHSLKSQPMD